MTRPVRERVRTRLSVAIQVVGAVSGRVLTSRVGFLFPDPEQHWEPRLTSDGYHVFVGIPVGHHVVRITAPAHQPLDTAFTVPESPDDSNAVLTFALQPLPLPAIR